MRYNHYPLESFSLWLRSQGASDATILSYTSRVRTTLKRMGCPDDSPASLQAHVGNEQVLYDYLIELALSSCMLTRTAWTHFARFLATQGIQAAIIAKADAPQWRTQMRPSLRPPPRPWLPPFQR